MELPDAVHHDAGESGIVAAGDPFGERFAAQRRGCVQRRLGYITSAESAGKAGLNFFAEGFGIAAYSDERLRRVTADVYDSWRHGRRTVAGEHLQETVRDGIE